MAVENVESDLLPSPTNEEVKSLRHDSLVSLRETCSLCLNPSMLLLNGTEMECGHLCHLSCLREANDPLRGLEATCVHCGSECKAAVKRQSVSSSTYSCDSSISLNEEKGAKGCDVAPLDIRTYVHASGLDTYEVIIRISATKSLANSPWKHSHTKEEQERLNALARTAISATQVANGPAIPCDWGSLRLVSSFTFNTLPVTGYLFERCVVLLTVGSDGFEDLVAKIDLEDEATRVGCVPGQGLRLKDSETDILLEGSRLNCSKWSSAFNNLSLKFPLDHDTSALHEPINLGQLDSCQLDCVICTPINNLPHLIPKVLQELGPQDRLGLVVVTKHGTCAWLAPHKPSWKHWRDMANLNLESCDHFVPASSPILETAEKILSDEESHRQRSVIVISGCPLVSITVSSSLTVHAIGHGAQYDLNLLAKLPEQSNNGRFHHVDDQKSLASCCAGLVAADRTSLYNDVNLRVTLRNECAIVSATPSFDLAYGSQIGDTSGLNSRSSIIPIGSLVSGQSRTVLLEIESPKSKVGSVLAVCTVESKSSLFSLSMTASSRAIVDHRISSAFVSRPVFFERLILISAEILQECTKLAREEKYETMISLLQRAASKIESTAAAASGSYSKSNKRNSIVELTEPENSPEAQVLRSQLFSKGLLKLCQQIRKEIGHSGPKLLAMLLEAAQVLQTQCAVSDKTLLEAVFFESLECNRI